MGLVTLRLQPCEKNVPSHFFLKHKKQFTPTNQGQLNLFAAPDNCVSHLYSGEPQQGSCHSNAAALQSPSHQPPLVLKR